MSAFSQDMSHRLELGKVVGHELSAHTEEVRHGCHARIFEAANCEKHAQTHITELPVLLEEDI